MDKFFFVWVGIRAMVLDVCTAHRDKLALAERHACSSGIPRVVGSRLYEGMHLSPLLQFVPVSIQL